MPDADWWRVLWPHPEDVLVEMSVRPRMVAVDLCCGDGLFTAPLASIADRVYAIDIEPVTLDRARVRVVEAGATNCDFVLADAMTVDAIVPGCAPGALRDRAEADTGKLLGGCALRIERNCRDRGDWSAALRNYSADAARTCTTAIASA